MRQTQRIMETDVLNTERTPRISEETKEKKTNEESDSHGLTDKQITIEPTRTFASVRHNNVCNVMLQGVPIVSLTIDGKDRLCLAQISNTLLKRYSYNEIHNRRVALGITCVQCTPVQLEILRRAGAMPISSRRCGMITKREAERLVKSFLEDSAPPKLPESFYFDVYHECGWGGRGHFEPARYNSSRAKCIKCTFCNIYFSPNKFIFHFHRVTDGKYNHPDAANFNSWRRHLKLVNDKGNEEIPHAWEDVKAMFNGGSRKRMMTISDTSRMSRTSSDICKKPKLQIENGLDAKPTYTGQYPAYPFFTLPGKTFPYNPVASPNSFGYCYPYRKDAVKQPTLGTTPWVSQASLSIPSYDMLWGHPLNMHSPTSNIKSGFYMGTPLKEINNLENNNNLSSKLNENDTKQDPAHSIGKKKAGEERLSAFRPIARNNADLDAKAEHDQCDYSGEDTNGDIDIIDHSMCDDDSNDQFSDDQDLVVCDNETECEEDNCGIVASRDSHESDIENPDDSPGDLSNSEENGKEHEKSDGVKTAEDDDASEPLAPGKEKDTLEKTDSDTSNDEVSGNMSSDSCDQDDSKVDASSCRDACTPIISQPSSSKQQDVALPLCTSGHSNEDYPEGLTPQHLMKMTKEQLHEELQKQLKTRREIEQEIDIMKETFQEQVSREKTYRDEMAHQLQIVRETLSNELEQERKTRFSLQAKLKEAHDALHSFSCKMLASRQCAECAYKESTLPR